MFNIRLNNVTDVVTSNKTSFNMFCENAQKGNYLTLLPKTSKKGEAYFWVTAIEKGNGTSEFKLAVNQPILDAVMTYIFGGKLTNVDVINPDEDLDTFSKEWSNFALELHKAELSKGKTMNRTFLTKGLKISSFYKKGVIVYEPNKNLELKTYIQVA